MQDTSANAAPVKPHGCMCPMHPLQLVSYLLFTFYAYVFYFVELVTLRTQVVAAVLVAIFYSALFFAVACVAVAATLSDPTDPTVAEERRKKMSKYESVLLDG